MKKCPYCATELWYNTAECTHCGELLPDKPQAKWYFKTSWIIVAFLCVGPFALPLIWFSPHIGRNTKIILTVVIGIISYCLGILFANSLKAINAYYQQIF